MAFNTTSGGSSYYLKWQLIPLQVVFNTTSWRIPVTTGADGTVQLRLVNFNGMDNGITNAPYDSQSYTVDKTPPAITISAPSVTTINAGAGSVTYNVTYTDANFNSSTLQASNITLNKTGADGVVEVSGTGLTRTVTISNITGSGSLGISINANTASDVVANSAAAAGPSATFNVTVPPVTLQSLTRLEETITRSSRATYLAVFSGSVTGLTANNFSLTTTTTGASVSELETEDNTNWYIHVNTGTDGNIQLNLANSTGLSAPVSNTLPFTGEVFTIDKTKPTITISAPSVSTISAGAGSVTYTVTYADAHFDSSMLESGYVDLIQTGTASGDVAVSSGSGTTRTVTISNISGSGTLGISIKANSALDVVSNSAAAAGPSATFNVVTPVEVQSLYGAGDTFTNAASINYRAIFSGPVTGVTAGNFSLATTTGASIGTPTTDDNLIWSIPITTGTDGTFQLSLINATGLSSPITTTLPFNGSTYTIDKTGPAITIGAPSASTISPGAGTVTYAVDYSDPNFNTSTLAVGDINLIKTGTANGEIAVAGLEAHKVVTIDNITGSGTLSISINANTAVDWAGNNSPAAGPSATFDVVSIPVITFSAFSPATYGDDNIDLNATSDYNGTPVTYSSDNTDVATITGDGKVHIVAAGTVNITASQAGDGSHSAAADVVKLLTINQAPLTITANNKTKVYGAARPPLTASYSGFVNGETAADIDIPPMLSTTATAGSSVAGSPYTITATG
ncbi:MAG: hypothetical protein EOP51_23165, partial [Sphingobacteriales bacterium]